MVDYRPFAPDWVSPPGETIATILQERGVTTDQFAASLHRTKREVEDLLGGRLEISPDVAGLLAAVLGAPVAFWLNKESRCRTGLTRLHAVRAPKSCKASGATKFMTPTKPLVLLSFRYLSDDHFWFTFFHEVAHLLLHADVYLFLEGDDRLSTAEKEEANAFAADTLIPPEHLAEMSRLPADGIEVVRFAKHVGVSPGIVVGQLQHRGVLRRNQLNNLKRRYAWVEADE